MNAVQTLLTGSLDIWTAAETEKRSSRGRSAGNASSVYGIKKLRELILELAVRGKLVPQDANDEPANELLKRIQVEKAKLIAEGKIKKDKPWPLISAEARPFELPQGWEWTTLAYISTVNPRNIVEDNLQASFVPMTMIGTSFNYFHDKEARLWKEIKQGFTHFANGDIGVAKITPCFENSKACVFSGLLNGVGAGTTELHIVRPVNATLAPRYVLAYLKSPRFLLVGETRMTGTAGQKRLPKEFVESNPFPLPPLAEQHRIVAKVDELMALCGQLETRHSNAAEAHEKLVSYLLGTLNQSQSAEDFSANWQRIAEHFETLFTTEASIEALKQTVLQLAVMGKLLNAIYEKNKAKKECADHGRLDLIKNFRNLPAFPKHWRLKNLFEVSAALIDCPHSTPKWTTEGMICVRTSQFRAGQLDLAEAQYVSEKTYHERVQRLVPMEDDILYSREGGILGVACRVPQGIKLCLGQRMMLIRAGTEISPIFLEMLLNSPMITSIARAMTTGGAAPRVNVSTVKAYPTPLPPMEEQQRIITKVNELMMLCDRLKSRIADASRLQQKIADVMVERAVA